MYPYSCLKGHKWFRKGYFKYLVLYILKEKSMHGYDISKAIKEIFRGVYIPSPGLLYPTLKRMEKMGLIDSDVDEEGTKVYIITKRGLDELKRREKSLMNMLSELNSFLDSGTIELIKVIKALMRTLEIYYPELDQEKISEICQLLKNVRKRIEEIAER